MLMCTAEYKTTWGVAAETRLLFQDQRVTLPPTAWQANMNFLLWLCAERAATLEFNSMVEINKIKQMHGMQVHFYWKMFDMET